MHSDVAQRCRLDRSGSAVGSCSSTHIVEIGLLDPFEHIVVNLDHFEVIFSFFEGLLGLDIALIALAKLCHLNLLTQEVAILIGQAACVLRGAKRSGGSLDGSGGFFAVASGCGKFRRRLLSLSFERSQVLGTSVYGVDQLLATVPFAGCTVALRFRSAVVSS